MNHRDPLHERMGEADEREWLAQERAMREERLGAAPSEDPLLASYRSVVRAARAPLPDALPADFASNVARTVAARRPSPARVDTRLEQQVQRVLLALLALATLAACVVYGGDWLHATFAALPLLDRATTLNWAAALGACLGLSWALDVLRQRALAR